MGLGTRPLSVASWLGDESKFDPPVPHGGTPLETVRTPLSSGSRYDSEIWICPHYQCVNEMAWCEDHRITDAGRKTGTNWRLVINAALRHAKSLKGLDTGKGPQHDRQ